MAMKTVIREMSIEPANTLRNIAISQSMTYPFKIPTW